MKITISLFILICISLLITACISGSPSPELQPPLPNSPTSSVYLQPTATLLPNPQISSTPFITLLPTLTLLPNPSPTLHVTLQPTPTQAPFSTFSTLPSGHYAIFSDTARGTGLYAISIGSGLITKLTDYDGSSISVDNQLIVAYDFTTEALFLLNLNQNTIAEVPSGICGVYQYSSDFIWLAIDCVNDDRDDIFVRELSRGIEINVTNSQTPEAYYVYPLWSPDGKWLSFLNSTNGPNTPHGDQDFDDGLYLMDTSCLPSPEDCHKNTYGPYQGNIWLQWPYAWSPNSRFLAIMSSQRSGPIQIFDVESRSFHPLDSTNNFASINSLAWSLDNDILAFSSFTETDMSTDIYISPFPEGRTHLLVDSQGEALLLFWIRIPFEPGDTITSDGTLVELTLHETPSEESEIMAQLSSPDITFELIDGPIEDDGAYWWKIRVLDGNLEGWTTEGAQWYIRPEE